jgi:diguanylate cyclase (GGDEF)-like protein
LNQIIASVSGVVSQLCGTFPYELTSLSGMNMPNKTTKDLVKIAEVPSLVPVGARDFGVLRILPEGIFLAVRDKKSSDVAPVYMFGFCNPAFARLAKLEADAMVGQSLDTAFQAANHTAIGKGLKHVEDTGIRTSVDIALGKTPHQRFWKLTMVPHDDGVIALVNDRTATISRENYLEDRAVKLIDQSNVLESSRRDLEGEVLRLRAKLNDMERAAKFDSVSGLPNRTYFLERAGAEFQRSQRYAHDLALVVFRIQGLADITKKQGAEVGNRVVTSFGQICETVCRGGTDIAGRMKDDEVAILLPETNLTGALMFVDRLRSILSNTPVNTGDGYIRLGVQAGVDALQSDDTTFSVCMQRAKASMATGKI